MDNTKLFEPFVNVLPPAYMTASMMEEIQATSLYEALKILWMSLKNTVVAFGKA